MLYCRECARPLYIKTGFEIVLVNLFMDSSNYSINCYLGDIYDDRGNPVVNITRRKFSLINNIYCTSCGKRELGQILVHCTCGEKHPVEEMFFVLGGYSLLTREACYNVLRKTNKLVSFDECSKLYLIDVLKKGIQVRSE